MYQYGKVTRIGEETKWGVTIVLGSVLMYFREFLICTDLAESQQQLSTNLTNTQRQLLDRSIANPPVSSTDPNLSRILEDVTDLISQTLI